MQGSLIPFPEFKSKKPLAHPWGPVQAAATHSHPTERQRRDTGETKAATWHHTDQGLRSVGAGSPASLTHHPALLQRLQNRALFRLWSNQWLHKITSPLLQNNSKQKGSLNPCFPASFLFLSRNAHLTVQAAEFWGRHMAPAVLLSRRMCKARHTHCCSATPDTCCLRCWSTACLGKGTASLGLIPFWYCHSSENLVQPVLCCQVKHRACFFFAVTGRWAPSHSWDFPQDIAQGTALTVPLADWVKSKPFGTSCDKPTVQSGTWCTVLHSQTEPVPPSRRLLCLQLLLMPPPERCKHYLECKGSTCRLQPNFQSRWIRRKKGENKFLVLREDHGQFSCTEK